MPRCMHTQALSSYHCTHTHKHTTLGMLDIRNNAHFKGVLCTLLHTEQSSLALCVSLPL